MAQATGLQRPGPTPFQRHLNLTRELAITQFKLKYTGSVLGYLWSLLRPLLYFGVMYTVFVGILHVGASSPHFALQLLLGIVVWTFFQETTSTALVAVASNGHMLRKAYFPRVIPVFASTLTALMTFSINLVILLLIGLVMGQVDLGPQSIAALLYIVELYVLIIGVSLLLSSLYVFYRDLGHIWEVGSQLLFYGSAVVFPFAILHSATSRTLVALNPIAQIVEDMRHLLISGAPAVPLAESVLGARLVLVPFLLVLAVLGLGTVVFRHLTPRFAECL